MANLYVPIIDESLSNDSCGKLYNVTCKIQNPLYKDKGSSFNGFNDERVSSFNNSLKNAFYPNTFSFKILENDNKNEAFIKFSERISSISLGLFCAAYRITNNRVFKKKYDSITITGKYNVLDKKVILSDVKDIDKKYEIVKQYAKKHSQEKHLFLYISSEEFIPEGIQDDNIFVIRYDVSFPIECVFAEIFEGLYAEEQNTELVDLQIKDIESSFLQTRGIISWKKQFINTDFNGLILKGDTNTGKTITAKFLCKWLMDTSCVDDIVWITVTDNLRFYRLLQESRTYFYSKNQTIKPNEIEQYFEKEFLRIRELLQIGKRILIVIDNVEAEYVDEIVDYFSYNYANDIKLIISSWYSCRKETSLFKLKILEKNISDILPSDNEFPLLVKKIIRASDLKINYNELNKNQQNEVINALYPICKHNPGLISVALNSLTKKTIEQWFQDIKVIKNGNNDIVESLFQLSLEVLDFFSQIVLFTYLGKNDFDSDINILSYQKIIKKKIFSNKIDISESNISSSLEELVKRRILEKHGLKISIKNDALKFFVFSKNISNELQSIRATLITKQIAIKYAIENTMFNEFYNLTKDFDDKHKLNEFLTIACKNDVGIPFFRRLLELGADLNFAFGKYYNLAFLAYNYCHKTEVLEYLIKSGLDYSKTCENNLSPMISLPLNSSDEIFNYVLDNHLYTNIDEYNETPLFYACLRGDINRVKKLLSAGANPAIVDKYGQTIFSYIIMSKNIDLLCYFLENHIYNDLEKKDIFGFTTILQSIVYGNIEFYKLLIKYGANSYAVDKNGYSSLILAAQYNSQILKFILDNKLYVNIDEKSKGKNTALLRASCFSSFLLLLNNGANPNTITSKGNNLLHIAVMMEDKKRIKYILKNLKNVNPNLKNKAGKRPVDLTTNKEIIRLFDVLYFKDV